MLPLHTRAFLKNLSRSPLLFSTKALWSLSPSLVIYFYLPQVDCHHSWWQRLYCFIYHCILGSMIPGQYSLFCQIKEKMTDAINNSWLPFLKKALKSPWKLRVLKDICFSTGLKMCESEIIFSLKISGNILSIPSWKTEIVTAQVKMIQTKWKA